MTKPIDRRLEILRLEKRIEKLDYLFEILMAFALVAVSWLWVYLEIKANK